MKYLSVLAFAFVFLFVLVSPVCAQDSPVDEITAGLAGLPDLYGLGVLVALAVVLMRKVGLPDGYGGYAAFGVGVATYIILQLVPDETARTIFDIAAHVASAALIVLGGQVTHASLKYGRFDRFWKGKD